MLGPALSLRAVVALADRFPVLAGVDLEVSDGEVVLLEGSNGAGKTSLLRVLAGLLPISDGTASVFGSDLQSDRVGVRAMVGYFGHDPLLYEDLTVRENVEFFVRIAGTDRSRIEPALERLGLGGRLADTPVGRCSQGQRRRVGLALLVARSPRLWLLDEPHAGLDAETRTTLDALIDEASKAGCTVVYSSHEAHRVAARSHRIVRIEGGRVVADVRGAVDPAVVRSGGGHVA